MIRRLIVISLVLVVAFLLLVLQNKVFVGSQKLQPELTRPEPEVVQLVFRDAAGRPVPISGPDALGDPADLIADIRERLDKDPPGPDEDAIPYEADSFTFVDDQTVRFELAELPPPGSQAGRTFDDLLRTRLQGKAFEQSNRARSLFYIPLGIDLRGGVEFTTRLYDQQNRVVPADDEVVQVLRRRLDARGLVEPQVFRLTSGDVQVVIPGGTQADAARTRKVLETTGRLEEREVLAIFERHPNGTWQYAALGDAKPGVRNFRPVGPDISAYIEERPTGGYEFKREYWGELYPSGRQFSHVVYPGKVQPGEQIERFYHLDEARLTGEDIDSAEQGFDDSGRLAVNITYTTTGAPVHEAFGLHVKGRGDRGIGSNMIAISLDGVVESAPQIIGVAARHSQITGQFTEDEVESLRTVLVAGSLAVTPRVTAERVVGPSLGQATIDKGMWSMLAGLALIVLVMWFYYRIRLGAVAVTSLVVTVGLVFVVLSIFGATLTLPGLAGLVLTVGMAVDANILIFERLREELSEDVDVRTGIENGYARAFITILDANLTTFITAFILYLIGSGPVKGFGLTLMVGIVTSMFGAIYVGRFVTGLLYRKASRITVPELIKDVKLPYVKWRFGALVLSVVVGIGSWAVFLTDGELDDHFDIDFTGGNMVQVVFERPLSIEQVQEELAAAHAGGADMLDPTSIQLLPYFADFGEAGGDSRQWMFKGRDPRGAALERERAGLEDERASAYRQLEQLELEQQDPEKTTDRGAEIAQLRQQIADLDERIGALTAKVEDRQRNFQRQLQSAFADNLQPEGSQVVSASSSSARRVELTLAVLEQPDTNALRIATERLLERHDTSAVDVEAVEAEDGRPAVQLAFEFAEPAPEAAEYPEADPVVERVRAMLGQDARPGQVRRSIEAYDRSVDALATAGIAVDQPFPSSQHFSPLVGDQMKWQALIAMLVAVACVLAYIAARFEFRYGIGAIVALVHDVVIAVGMLTFLHIRIDLTVVAALLTLIGYSLNDTIVVFDRIRENIRRMNAGLAEIIDISIAQTMSRTILTTGTTLGVVVILYFFGGEGVNAFSGALLIGLILGTYSSIFVAAPVLLMLNKGRPSASLVEAATIDPDADLRSHDEDAEAALPAEAEVQEDPTPRR